MSVLDASLGPILIGTFLNVWLYGMVLVQVCLYYAVYRDNAWIRLVVALLTVLETVITVFHVGFVYRYTITLFGNFDALAHSYWFFHMSPLLTVSIASTVQGFFAWRINRLTEQKWLSIGVGLLVLTQFAAGAASTAGAFRVVDFARFVELRVPVVMWLVTSVVTDVVITTRLTWYLHTHKTGFSRTDDLITRLIRLTVQTGLITTIWAAVDLIVFLTVPTALHLLFNLPLSKLYTISLLSTLNARGGWEGTITGGVRSVEGVSIPPSMIRDMKSTVPVVRISRRVETDAGRDSFELGEYSKSRGEQSIDIEKGGTITMVDSTVRLSSPAEAPNVEDWTARSPTSSGGVAR